MDEPHKLPPGIREICVKQLANVGGFEWAEKEVDTAGFIEMAEKLMASIFNQPDGEK